MGRRGGGETGDGAGSTGKTKGRASGADGCEGDLGFPPLSGFFQSLLLDIVLF